MSWSIVNVWNPSVRYKNTNFKDECVFNIFVDPRYVKENNTVSLKMLSHRERFLRQLPRIYGIVYYNNTIMQVFQRLLVVRTFRAFVCYSDMHGILSTSIPQMCFILSLNFSGYYMYRHVRQTSKLFISWSTSQKKTLFIFKIYVSTVNVYNLFYLRP